MKTRHFFFGIASAAMMLAGCEANEIKEAPVTESTGSTFELIADIAQTKTTMDANYKVSWKEGDKIYMVTSDETWGKPYTEDNSAATVAEFIYNDGKFTTQATIANSDDPYTFYAMYCNQDNKSWHRGAGSSDRLFSTQSQDCSDPTAHIGDYDALVGSFEATVPMEGMAEVTMQHIYTLMQVNVKNATGNEIAVTKFEMTAKEGTDLTGIFNIDFSKSAISSVKTGYGESITVNIENGTVAAGESLPVYFVMAPLADYSGDITFKVTDSNGNTYTKTATLNNISFEAGKYNTTPYTISEADEVEIVDNKTDVLTRDLTGVTANSSIYTVWTGKQSNTNAVYAGQSAGGNDAIQLRSNNDNSGIVTTTSGGYVSRIQVTWDTNTSNGRVLNVYGKNNSYDSPEDLYDSATQGTLIGTIIKGTSTELSIKGNYEFIGIRSASGAMYIDEIRITWTDVAQEMPKLTSISVDNQTTEFQLNQTFVFDGIVTAEYEDGSSKKVSPTNVSSPDMTEVGTQSVTVSYTEGDVTQTCSYDIFITESSEIWTQVTSLNDIVSGEYVIVAKTSSKVGFLPSITTTNSAPSYNTDITITDDKISAVSDNMIFTFTVDNGGVTIKNVDGKYLYMTNSNNGVRVGTTPFTWTVEDHDKSGTFKFSGKTSSKTRYLGVYNNQDWRCYDTYNATNFTSAAGSSAILLYKKSN